MVVCESEKVLYRAAISNGRHEISVDTTEEQGGGASAMRPHELLEAALASCLNMTIRIYADKNSIPLTRVITKVSVDRTQPGKTTFNYSFSFEGTLAEEQREELNKIAGQCAVRETLSKTISFVRTDVG
jgi:putative redox protein